ncbi:hypothetical protein CDD83_9554 [Cordyceps sp. RAO-2017]|nr:hypothetical protein CDD83_9554 [Cordyceps sp. RAO-2017]
MPADKHSIAEGWGSEVRHAFINACVLGIRSGQPCALGPTTTQLAGVMLARPGQDLPRMWDLFAHAHPDAAQLVQRGVHEMRLAGTNERLLPRVGWAAAAEPGLVDVASPGCGGSLPRAGHGAASADEDGAEQGPGSAGQNKRKALLSDTETVEASVDEEGQPEQAPLHGPKRARHDVDAAGSRHKRVRRSPRGREAARFAKKARAAAEDGRGRLSPARPGVLEQEARVRQLVHLASLYRERVEREE